MSGQSRSERDLAKARAAGARRLRVAEEAAAFAEIQRRTSAAVVPQQSPAHPPQQQAQQQARQQQADRYAWRDEHEHNRHSSSSNFHADHPSSASHFVQPAAASSSSSFSAAPSRDIDIARAWASEHRLRDGAHHFRHLQQQSQQQAASSSSSDRPLPGRGASSYDFRAVLDARAALADRVALEQLAAQEVEDRREHAEHMSKSLAKLRPFEVTHEWRRKWKKSTHTHMCGVCLDKLEVGQMIMQLPCDHAFHSISCLQPWLDRQSVCPMCRYDIKQMKTAEQCRRDEPEGEFTL